MKKELIQPEEKSMHSWLENEQRNKAQLSSQQPISLEDATAQVQRLKEQSQAHVKKVPSSTAK